VPTDASADLEKIRAGLRRAITAENYAEAETLLTGYCHAVEAAWRGMTPAERQGASLEGEATALLESVRRLVLAGRAHATAKLERLTHSTAYGRPAAKGLRTWQVEL
jgi:hypothetical protein